VGFTVVTRLTSALGNAANLFKKVTLDAENDGLANPCDQLTNVVYILIIKLHC